MTDIENINIISSYLQRRDVENLNDCKVDVLVLFGGSILLGADIFADAIIHQVCRTSVIVGGYGHTTDDFIKSVNELYPYLEIEGCSEAEIFDRYIFHKYGIHADYLECESLNCGSNITNLLELLEKNHISFSSIGLIHDGSMQQRIDATLRKYAPDKKIINYCSYQVSLNSDFTFSKDLWSMWTLEHYLQLHISEISRLKIDGYGPKGKNYIARVDIPDKVLEAYDELKEKYKDYIR